MGDEFWIVEIQNKINAMRYLFLLFGIAGIFFLSCKKSGGNNSSTNPYDGSWKLQLLASGCGTSSSQNTTVSSGSFSVGSFTIVCTPLVSYSYNLTGLISSGGMLSGNVNSNYGSSTVAISGSCSSPDSCSATGTGITVTMTK
jgi:hypothetical protein